MKKLLGVLTILIIVLLLTLSHSDTNLTINTNKINVSKDKLISLAFNKKYNIETNKSNIDKDIEKELIILSKKTTYYLLGSNNETDEEYFERHNAYLSLKYSPEIPIINGESDKKSLEYKMSNVSDISVPGMFLSLNNLNTKYSTIGNIDISYNKKFYLSQVTLPNITMLEEDENSPKRFNKVTTNMIINYYFVKYNDIFYLYYLNAYTKNNLSTYSDSAFAIKSDVSNKSIYDYTNYNNLTINEINNTFNTNKNNIFSIESFNTNKMIDSSIAVLIEDGIILTTYNFIQNSLEDASYLTVKDVNNKYYDIDGIITISKENNIVLLKLKNKIKTSIKIDDNVKLEDAVTTITYDNKFKKDKSLVISNNNLIKTIEENDNSTLIFKDNKLLGITKYNSESTYKEYTKLTNLKDTLNTLRKTNFKDIDTKTFDYIKENYYIDKSIKYKEVSLPKELTNKYNILSNIKENISLPLIYYSKVDNNISLRYVNTIDNYLSNIELSKSLESYLLKNNYKKVLTSTNKCIYKNNKYKIITYSEFNYLIVMVVIL